MICSASATPLGALSRAYSPVNSGRKSVHSGTRLAVGVAPHVVSFRVGGWCFSVQGSARDGIQSDTEMF